MKRGFEAGLDFQLQAMEAVCDLFRGQEICRTEFTVTKDRAAPVWSTFCLLLIQPVR
jgi:type III restriction enzyme